MHNMTNLIKNEHMKIYSKKSIWVMYGILLAIVVLIGVVLTNITDDTENENWRTNLEYEIADGESTLAQDGLPNNMKNGIESNLALNKYRLDNDIPPASGTELWGFVESSASIISLIVLFTVIIGASAIANEFSKGTVKLLMIRPYKRWKILLSKYITVYLVAFQMLVFLLISSILIGFVFFGGNGASLPYLYFSHGEVKEMTMLLRIIVVYGFACVNLFVMSNFALMVSSLLRNNALAVGLTIFLMFTGSTIVTILVQLDQTWAKYIIFANTDLSVYFGGSFPSIEGMTLGFSVIVLLIYIIIFNVISFGSFIKRDIAV